MPAPAPATTEPTATATPPVPGPRSPIAWAVGRVRAYAELSKVRLSSLVLVTTAVGFVLAETGALRTGLLFWALLGTALCAFGASALNQWAEGALDQRMDRTRGRPLPSGRVSGNEALGVGLALVVAGGGLLAVQVNVLSSGLALLVAALYFVLYTPLKTRSSLCTQVGAVCGAIPPMIGWTASRDAIEPGAWVLFAILFVWQIPHFLAIDWFHRADYARGGYRMISAVDPTGRLTGNLTVIYSLALVPISLMAVIVGIGGYLYLAGAVTLGLCFLTLGVALNLTRSQEAARRLFLGSLLYLPMLLGLLCLDPTGPLR